MKIQMEISEWDFSARLRNYQQWENATAGELACLFHYLEEAYEEDGEAIEFDPIAWACEFNILTTNEIIQENQNAVIDYAYNEIGVIDSEDENFEEILKVIHSAGFNDEDIIEALFNEYIDSPIYSHEGYYLFHV